MKTIHVALIALPSVAWATALPGTDGRYPWPITGWRGRWSRDVPDVKQSAKRFSLSQVENKGFQGSDASVELIQAFLKYDMPLTPGMTEAIEINPDLNSKFRAYIDDDRGMGTVEAVPPLLFDIQYVVPVSLGSPPQLTHLNLDTGSADFWTFSTDTYQPSVRNQTVYRPKASNTSRLLEGEAWSIRYGDGAGASGIVYKDRVELGGTAFNDQAVQSAVQVSADISRDSFASGIMGMAKSGINTVRPTPQLSYFENILDSLEAPVFTANLQKGRPGNYNFGFVDASEHVGDVVYAPLLPGTSFWEIKVTGYQVAGSQYTALEWEALVDTGTSLLIVPQEIVDAYYETVPGAVYDRKRALIVFPCGTRLPDFAFGIGEYRGFIPGHYMDYGKATPSFCYGGIQATERGNPSVLGAVLLKAQFVVFDGRNNQVGFANKKLLPPPGFLGPPKASASNGTLETRVERKRVDM